MCLIVENPPPCPRRARSGVLECGELFAVCYSLLLLVVFCWLRTVHGLLLSVVCNLQGSAPPKGRAYLHESATSNNKGEPIRNFLRSTTTRIIKWQLFTFVFYQHIPSIIAFFIHIFQHLQSIIAFSFRSWWQLQWFTHLIFKIADSYKDLHTWSWK